MVEEMGQDKTAEDGPETKHTPEEIEAIEEKYFGNWPLKAIQAAHKISDYELRQLRKEQGWPLRRRRVTAQGLVKRLLALVDAQVTTLERLQERSHKNGLNEKRVDIIGRTAATLQRLIAMDSAFHREAKPRPPKAMTETQVRLAQQLEEFRRR